MSESLRRKRETIARLRAMADEMEAELPEEPPDQMNRARMTASERARRRGITLIQGTGVAVAALAAARWVQQHTIPAALLLAGTAAAGGMTLAPLVAPVLPGVPVVGDRDPAPAVTRTIAVPAPAPTQTVTVSPSPSPTPTPTPSPSAPPSTTPSPSPSPSTTGTPRAAPTGASDQAPAAEPDGGNAPPTSPPPAAEQPAPPGPDPGAETQTMPCVIGVALPPLLGLCVLGGGT